MFDPHGFESQAAYALSSRVPVALTHANPEFGMGATVTIHRELTLRRLLRRLLRRSASTSA